MKEITLNGHAFEFPIDYRPSGLKDILNTHEHFTKKNIKWCLDFVNRYMLSYPVLMDH